MNEETTQEYDIISGTYMCLLCHVNVPSHERTKKLNVHGCILATVNKVTTYTTKAS